MSEPTPHLGDFGRELRALGETIWAIVQPHLERAVEWLADHLPEKKAR